MRMILAASLFALVAGVAQAETCAERFMRHYAQGSSGVPVRIHVTQEIKGGATSTNYSYQTGDGDWMTEMIEPTPMERVLARDNVLYTSSDGGKSWTKARDLDPPPSAQQKAKDHAAIAATVRDAVCATETVDGKTYDTVTASYEIVKYSTKHRETFWVDPATDRVARARNETQMAGFSSVTTQVIEAAPGLELPDPAK